MRLLFEGGFYSRAAFIRGRLLFEGGFYSRAAFIRGRLLLATLRYVMKDTSNCFMVISFMVI